MRKSSFRVLGIQLIEWPVVLPADHVFAGDFADDFVAAFFFEDLLERLELGNAFDPFLALELLLKAMSSEGALGDVVDFVLVLNLEVRQRRIDGGADVARQRPGRSGPNQEIF